MASGGGVCVYWWSFVRKRVVRVNTYMESQIKKIVFLREIN